jgi:hypothetical protein
MTPYPGDDTNLRDTSHVAREIPRGLTRVIHLEPSVQAAVQQQSSINSDLRVLVEVPQARQYSSYHQHHSGAQRDTLSTKG